LGNKKQFYSDLSIFQYSKFLALIILFRLIKNSYITQFIYDQIKTHVQLRFVWFVSESDYRGSKSSFIQIYLSSNISNSSDVVILFRLMKKTVISANLFTPEQKLTFNCILCDSLVNQIFGEQKAVLFGSICLPIFQILWTL
jgi:hypothetical protein